MYVVSGWWSAQIKNIYSGHIRNGPVDTSQKVFVIRSSMDYLTILDSVSKAIRMFTKPVIIVGCSQYIEWYTALSNIKRMRATAGICNSIFCFTMAFDTYMYGQCLCPIDMKHPHLELSVKMKLSWCPAGGKVKRRCSRNHWVGKSASVLVALWLFKSSFPPASLCFYVHCATFSRSLNIHLPYMWSTIGQQEQEMRPLGN